jgi:Zn-finger nucleic acid-binding protein
MDRIDDRGLVLDRCTACGGTWYDKGELEAELGRRGTEHKVVIAHPEAAELAVPHPDKRGHCPSCTAQLRPHPHRSGIVIHGCPEHGVFLAAHDLDAIRAEIARYKQAEAEHAKEATRLKQRLAPPSVYAARTGGHYETPLEIIFTLLS